MKVDHFTLPPSDWVPNHPTLPVLVYSHIRSDLDSSALEDMFHDHGWTGVWRNGVFAYHHYHSGAHEVLGVGRGNARLQIGGPDGKILDVKQGIACFCQQEPGTSDWKVRAIFRSWVPIRPVRRRISSAKLQRKKCWR